MTEYISRLAALKAFKLTAKNPNKDYQRGLQDAIDCLVPEVIAGIPSADVQPVKRGKWLHFNSDGIIFCSECKHEAYWDTDYGQQLFDYCPYCGARMIKDGEQNENN